MSASFFQSNANVAGAEAFSALGLVLALASLVAAVLLLASLRRADRPAA